MLQQILPNVLTFRNLFIGRVYLVEDEDGFTLVDTGHALAAKQIQRALENSGHKLEDIRRIAITHTHPDHASNLPWLKAKSGASLIGPASEKDALEGRAPMETPQTGIGKAFPRLYLPKCTVDVPVRDGDLLPILGGTIVIETPGHTSGAVAYWQPSKRLLFCGDVLIRFPKTRLPFSVFTMDMKENVRSIINISKLDPAALMPGHGRPITENTSAHLRAFAQKSAARFGLPI